MIVFSCERHTFPGNTDYVAVLLGRRWVPCSSIFGSRYVGRDSFFLEYEVKVANDAIVATFTRRTDSELVEVDSGFSFDSFEAADRWAAEDAPYTCPLCGALLE